MPVVNEKLAVMLEKLTQLEEKKFFFLGGFVKSGTTWAERILDAHPNVVCKGEAHFGALLEPAVREALATYNSLIPKKGNWARHSREGGRSAPSPKYSYMTSDMDLLFARTIQLMLMKWDNSTEIKCIGEKTPNNSEHFERLQKLFPDARFVYLVRDVRDVAVSGWFFNLAVASKRTLEKFQNINEYALHISDLWVRNVARALRFIEKNNESAFYVRYEDLWASPLDEATRLFKGIGADTDEQQIRACIASTDFSRLSGGRDRGMENRSSFFRKGVVGDWTNHLNAETVSEIDSKTKGLMNRLGYE